MTPSYGAIKARARAEHLDIFGAFHPTADDGAPADCGTLFLLGPHEPGFWAHFTASAEYTDGTPNPVDRWSRRVVGELATAFNGTALFPFTGPPWHPFLRWGARSGRAWASPVELLVHDTAGLLVSYRGALALRDQIDLPSPPGSPPCNTCTDQPCRAACPVNALSSQGYDVPACHDYLTQTPDTPCLSHGCQVRTACPVSKTYARVPAQSAYHMKQFHP
ncbi:MAG: ferredoxin [Alphaproteobacteria bacterium]|nr:ferredoxin [Alphaproteobacteria bacterium]